MNYLPQEIIRKKRDKQPLKPDEIRFFARGIASGGISDSQIAAFAMAVYFNGLSMEDRTILTLAMRDSGDVLSWNRLKESGPIVDKHSTGGVGDVVSLILGPLLAACGANVPMISGRGLGHTGGTLDKLESIPGYNAFPDNELFGKTVKEAGVAIIGQTKNLAPADKRFYATRDITATVESIDLITASILSKKLAAGLDALVMDVKVGQGAFMQTYEASKELAQSITDVATAAGTPTTALLTDMNQCLASSAGNAVEVHEALMFLKNDVRNPRLGTVVFSLGTEVLQMAGLASNNEEALAKLEDALVSGKATIAFGRMVNNLGGPVDLVEKPENYLPEASIIRPVFSDTPGIASKINTRGLGLLVVRLGGGRIQVNDAIDHSVGLSKIASLGSHVDRAVPLAVVHANSETDFEMAEAAVRKFIRVEESFSRDVVEVYERITPQPRG